MKKIIIDGENLSIDQVVDVARDFCKIELSDLAIKKINKARKLVDKYVEEEKVVYGITTGFGKFSDIYISKSETKKLQKNLIMSHACGVGNPLSEEISRAIMTLRVNALAKGNSGIRLSTINTLIDMINGGVTPIIPEKGSLGASGDLAPLAHMVLVMMGKGEAIYNGVRMSGAEAMEKADIQTVELTSKEGLALINGTQVMTAVATLTIYDALNLMKSADIIASMTIEALNGIIDAFDERIHNVRPHNGQIETAKNISRILKNSNMVTRQGEIRVQDAYTLRCLPQIHGATRDAIYYVLDKINIEINSATDNPLIFSDEGDVISGGNFHGQPMALALDFLGIALSELANASERRIERLVNPSLSGLPAFLTEKGGLNSGFMILQYSAASLVSENKVLAHPASVDSIPSSANQEDHVSMGTIAARKAMEILKNTRNVLAMEMLASAQAIDLRGNIGLGMGTKISYEIIRNHIKSLNEDRVMYCDINKCEEILMSNMIVSSVEKEIGILN
ncbi:histidine ammonia-lyase [Clostridiisalibacter paucivorans]|uniref:histidine ammonia-lyase n=1 Tax=Clostridiisalibacter paucivorans TaxID=408753 RepID=UPI000479F0D4|nr:histidine ammonia-lyase [Clostridiisalibacter paucivorans]